MSSSKPPRLGPLLARLVLLSFSIVFALCVGEVGLRLLGYRGVARLEMKDRIRPVDDPIVDYRYKPNSEYWTGDVTYHFNSAGFRDIEHVTAKPPDTKRIVVIGDSVTVGHGVVTDEIFISQVREQLGTGVEAINIAMSGLNAPQVVHLLDVEGLRFEPDIVVLNFVLNDCDFYSRRGAAIDFDRKVNQEIGLLGIRVNPKLKELMKSSALIYFLSQRAQRLFTDERAPDGDYVLRIWSSEKNRKKVSDAFDRFAALRDDHGFTPLILVWPVIADFASYPYREIHKWVMEEAVERGIEVIDLLPAFAAVGRHKDFALNRNDYFHPNARGHRAAANVFIGWMAGKSESQEPTVTAN